MDCDIVGVAAKAARKEVGNGNINGDAELEKYCKFSSQT